MVSLTDEEKAEYRRLFNADPSQETIRLLVEKVKVALGKGPSPDTRYRHPYLSDLKPNKDRLDRIKKSSPEHAERAKKLFEENVDLIYFIANRLKYYSNSSRRKLGFTDEDYYQLCLFDCFRGCFYYDESTGLKLSAYFSRVIKNVHNNIVARAEKGRDLCWRLHKAGGSVAMLYLPDETFSDWHRDHALMTESTEEVDYLLKHCSNKQLVVLAMRFLPMRLLAIGKILGISKERVRQIQAHAFYKLKKLSERDETVKKEKQ